MTDPAVLEVTVHIAAKPETVFPTSPTRPVHPVEWPRRRHPPAIHRKPTQSGQRVEQSVRFAGFAIRTPTRGRHPRRAHRQPAAEAPAIVDQVFHDFRADIQAATSDQDRLIAIARVIRNLHVLPAPGRQRPGQRRFPALNGFWHAGRVAYMTALYEDIIERIYDEQDRRDDEARESAPTPIPDQR